MIKKLLFGFLVLTFSACASAPSKNHLTSDDLTRAYVEISFPSDLTEADDFAVENETAARSRDLDEVKDEAIKAWKLETAISRAKTQAEDIIAANDFDAAVKSAGATLEQSSPFLQSGIGLDHEESSLIASASFSIEVGDKTLVETGGDSIIVIRLDDIIAGDEDTVTLRKNQLLADFKDHLVADTEDAIVKGLATLHDVEANPNAVVRLLIGSIN